MIWISIVGMSNMPRSSKTQDKTVFYGVRVSAEIAERVEAMRDQLQEQSPYTTVSTSDVLRKFIEDGSKTAEPVVSKSLSLSKSGRKRRAKNA